LPLGVLVVSGTNGKTTTTKMVATILGQRYQVLTNDTGGNFVRGVITSVVAGSDWRGRTPGEVAVFELDEAHAVRFCDSYRPDGLLLLNVLRDQLDRFGEIDTTAEILGTVVAATTRDVVLNRDDPRLAALADRTSAKVSYFGVAPDLRPMYPTDDELYAAAVTLSAIPADVELLRVQLGVTTEIVLRIGDETFAIDLKAEGTHNAQNAAAAAALAETIGLEPATIAAGLRAVTPAFGRGQSFRIEGRNVVLQLVKNPAGFRQSLRSVQGLAPAATVIAINDDYADGRDMSWLWDVAFTDSLAAGRGGWLVTSGTRATDMALRLRYDDIAVDHVVADLAEAVRSATFHVNPSETVVVFSTYTAMWQLHRDLERRADAVPPEPT
jgi:lipid II isoglutaminyl synthase (glutamine-hydrolysing)